MPLAVGGGPVMVAVGPRPALACAVQLAAPSGSRAGTAVPVLLHCWQAAVAAPRQRLPLARGLPAASRGRDRRRTARRLFDTGSFFGVGVPEALVIGLLGWFLLGPEELYRLAKKVGGWLGELRTFIAQAAKQYEGALDDESTRKAIDGIRQTQRTVSEISASWGSVAASLRDPLNLGATLESTYNRYSKPAVEPPPTKSYPDLEAEPTPVEATPFDAGTAIGSKAGKEPKRMDWSEEETVEELERKRAASRDAVKDLWYQAGSGEASASQSSSGRGLPKEAEGWLERLDDRLDELDILATRVEELREGILEDRAAIRAILEKEAAKVPVAEGAAAAFEPPRQGSEVAAASVGAHQGVTATANAP